MGSPFYILWNNRPHVLTPSLYLLLPCFPVTPMFFKYWPLDVQPQFIIYLIILYRNLIIVGRISKSFLSLETGNQVRSFTFPLRKYGLSIILISHSFPSDLMMLFPLWGQFCFSLLLQLFIFLTVPYVFLILKILIEKHISSFYWDIYKMENQNKTEHVLSVDKYVSNLHR